MRRLIALFTTGIVSSCGEVRDAALADGSLTDASANAANRSISLNGTNQFASTGNTGINLGLPVTYEAWAYTGSTSPTSLQRIVISERLTTNAYTPLQIQISQSGVWQCVFTNNSPQPSQQVNLNTSVTVAANTWTHLALALSDTSADCYVNGVLKAQQGVAITLPTTAKAGWEIGAGYQGGFPDGAFFAGLIDEVRVWSSYRSVDDIRSAMNAPLSGRENSLKAYWKFDDALLDATPNGFDLTGVGTPSFSTNVPY